LITATLADDLNVMPIPGVSAATAALSAAGLPTDSFVFLGFPAKKKSKRLQQLNDLASVARGRAKITCCNDMRYSKNTS
jgi:16S rRNA (cytidine1402-2'-O)-methyltransferase